MAKNWLSHVYENTGLFVFGEWYTGGTVAEKDMTSFANDSGMSLLDFRFANAIRNLYSNSAYTMQDFYDVLKATESDYEEVNDQVTFIDNHDMSRFSTLVNNNQSAVNQAYALLLTSRGVPTIYYGSEQYDEGTSDPDNRADISSFNQNTIAYQVISKLTNIRKNNQALAYGSTEERWINSDVLIFERKFCSSVALVAVNKGSSSYHIDNLYSSLPSGNYKDQLDSLLSSGSISVNNDGVVNAFDLDGGEVGVWMYDTDTVTIGDIDPSVGIVGNEVTITGSGFGNNTGQVRFGTTVATVTSWSDSLIRVKIPTVSAGDYEVTVTGSNGSEDTFSGFEVLTSSQIIV